MSARSYLWSRNTDFTGKCLFFYLNFSTQSCICIYTCLNWFHPIILQGGGICCYNNIFVLAIRLICAGLGISDFNRRPRVNNILGWILFSFYIYLFYIFCYCLSYWWCRQNCLSEGEMWGKRRHWTRLQCSWNDRPYVTRHPAFVQETCICTNQGSKFNPCLCFSFLIFVLWFIFIWSLISSFQQCSINYPDNGPLPLDAPSWCQAPFDPEGLLRSLLLLCQEKI